jgi:quinol monooxygenase YgiN
MIIIAGTISFADQANRDGAVAAVRDLQQSTRDTEPGCLAYSFAADSGEPTKVQVFESWADQASLAAHFEHPNFWATKALLRQFERAGESAVASIASTRRPRSTPPTARPMPASPTRNLGLYSVTHPARGSGCVSGLGSANAW